LSWLLALDTATPLGSVAVGDHRGARAEAAVGDRRHAAATLPAIEQVLRLAGVTFADLEGIVLADGPGSFTGLRIGFATAKGLLREHAGLALRVAPSLMGLAWHAAAFAGGPVAALYDALRGEVFAAVYAVSERRIETLLAPRLTTPEALVQAAPPVAIAVGDGAAAHAALMRQWTGRLPVGPPRGAPRAGALLELLDVSGATTVVQDPSALDPTYGRLAEAQTRWERAHGRVLPHSPGEPG
jgi:tRNA threonylcarbamoyladenosine biosynthesis protein TsaB